jgi:hypothetical protein
MANGIAGEVFDQDPLNIAWSVGMTKKGLGESQSVESLAILRVPSLCLLWKRWRLVPIPDNEKRINLNETANRRRPE